MPYPLILLTIATTFVATAILLPLLMGVCRAAGLVDRPALHKVNVRPIPLAGGLGIVLVSTIALLVMGKAGDLAWPLTAIGLMAMVGLIDDRLHLHAYPRLIVQALIVLVCIVHFGDIRIESLGRVYPGGPTLNLGLPAAYVFTTVCILALVNAFNMLDGIDGLAGTLFCVMLIGLLYLAPSKIVSSNWPLFSVLIGSTVGFLVYNLRSPISPSARVYLGDTGSLALSTALAILAIGTTQAEYAANKPASPLLAVWILAVPIMELASATLRRLISGQNVMTADRGHIHHRLAGWGLGVNQSVLLISIVAVGMMSLGIYLNRLGVEGWLLFGICMVIYVSYMFSMNWPLTRERLSSGSASSYSQE